MKLGAVPLGAWVRVGGRLARVCMQQHQGKPRHWTWIRWGGGAEGSEIAPGPWGPDTECKIVQIDGVEDEQGD